MEAAEQAHPNECAAGAGGAAGGAGGAVMPSMGAIALGFAGMAGLVVLAWFVFGRPLDRLRTLLDYAQDRNNTLHSEKLQLALALAEARRGVEDRDRAIAKQEQEAAVARRERDVAIAQRNAAGRQLEELAKDLTELADRNPGSVPAAALGNLVRYQLGRLRDLAGDAGADPVPDAGASTPAPDR